MQPVVGLSGYERNGLSAIYWDGRIAACEEGRVRRVRNLGIREAGWPAASIAALLGTNANFQSPGWRTAESAIHEDLSGGTLLDHHQTHARTSFLTSGLERAVVLVCDSQPSASETCWIADPEGLQPLPSIATNVSGIAKRLTQSSLKAGLGPPELRQLETLARQSDAVHAQDALKHCVDDVLQLASSLHEMEPRLPLCVGGGLFLNGYINLQLRASGLFEHVHVPPDPGNSGLGVGCVLPAEWTGKRLTPFLGPSFDDEEIKRVLDNCKLTYRYTSEEEQLKIASDGLHRGRLIGWFKDALEWGPRALGNRSILANPFASYVSQNLNAFLKRRPAHQTYSLAVLDEDLPRLFQRYVCSPFMEAEAEIHEGDAQLSGVTGTARRIRVQTVGHEDRPFARLLEQFKQDTGVGALVNTSFNGFHEPIVVTPRDAVRVFYGTGLDALAIGSFWLEK